MARTRLTSNRPPASKRAAAAAQPDGVEEQQSARNVRPRVAVPSADHTFGSPLELLHDSLWAVLVAQLGVEATLRTVAVVSRRLYRLVTCQPEVYCQSSIRLTGALCQAVVSSTSNAVPEEQPLHGEQGAVIERLAWHELFSRVHTIFVPAAAMTLCTQHDQLRSILLHCAPRSATLQLPINDIIDPMRSSSRIPLLRTLLGTNTTDDAAAGAESASPGVWSHPLTDLCVRCEDDDDDDSSASSLSATLTPPLCYPVLRSLRVGRAVLTAAQVSGLLSSSCFPQLTALDLTGCSTTQLPDLGELVEGQAVSLERLSLPNSVEAGRSRRLSADTFCEQLLDPITSQPVWSVAGLRELTICASMSGDSLARLIVALPSLELLNLSGSSFECCYWMAHLADALTEVSLSSSSTSASLSSSSTFISTQLPFSRLHTLRLLDWDSSDTPCCGKRFGPVPETAGLELTMDYDPDRLRRRKERDAAVSAINTRGMQLVIAHLSSTLKRLSFTFSSTCQWDGNVSPALRRLTELREWAISFPSSSYGDEEDPITPSDELISAHWLNSEALPLSHLVNLRLHCLPFGAAAMHALLSSMSNLRVVIWSPYYIPVDFLSVLLLLGYHCPLIEELHCTLSPTAPDLQRAAWLRVAADYPFLFQAQSATEHFPIPHPAFTRLRALDLQSIQHSRQSFDCAGWLHFVDAYLAPGCALSLQSLSIGYHLSERMVHSLRHFRTLERLQFSTPARGMAGIAYRAHLTRMGEQVEDEDKDVVTHCNFGGGSLFVSIQHRADADKEHDRARLSAYFDDLGTALQLGSSADAGQIEEQRNTS